MIDTVTRKPVQVRAHGEAPPYIVVPFQQLSDLERILNDRKIEYYVDEETISLDGKPEVIYVTLRRGTDPRLIQQWLDGVP